MSDAHSIEVRYAGFWLRAVAAVIDWVVCSILGYIVGFAVGIAMIAADSDPANIEFFAGAFGLLSTFLYFTVLESSAWRATLGKLALSLKVVDESGQQIAYARAVGRYLGKIVSALPLGIGLMMAGWTQRKQALHDMMAGCLVVRTIRMPERIRLPDAGQGVRG